MNLHFTFSIREISEVRDSEQVLRIPMYFTVTWEVCQESITNQQKIKIIDQENRLVVDKDHKSWDDDSTGPKNENTEEAEVRI